MIRPSRTFVMALAIALAGGTALAFHRQTPPVLALTTSGDTALPRLPASGRTTLTLALPQVGGSSIVTIKPYRKPMLVTPLGGVGDNQNPAISFTGTAVAYDTADDPTDSGLPGRQIVLAKSGTLLAVAGDPTGTSVNPAIDVAGQRIAFESTGDLANTGNVGHRQVFLRQPTGGVSQASFGVGTSRNPTLSSRRSWIAFESTSAPGTGLDTGVEQIWLGTTTGIAAAPITAGLGPSTRPSFSDDGHILAFQSTADLADTQANTGVPQIFIYDTKSKTSAQLTFDAGGCTDPGVAKVKREWRVGFVCSGLAFFFTIRDDQRYHVATPDGVTTRLLPELGKHFLVVATTSDLVNGSGATAGQQVYLVNLFKRPAAPWPTSPAVWFPYRGIK